MSALCVFSEASLTHAHMHSSVNICVFCFVFSALVRPVKALKVWPELVPGQLFLLPLLSCVGPGGQVSDSEDVLCPSSGDDSCCHSNGALLNSCY